MDIFWVGVDVDDKVVVGYDLVLEVGILIVEIFVFEVECGSVVGIWG